MAVHAHRLLRLVTVVLVLMAATAWSFAPIHGDGLIQRVVAAVAPCHQHAQPVQQDAACEALCAVSAPVHFVGQIACTAQIDAAKLTIVPAATFVSAPRRTYVARPDVHRSDGTPLYLTTRRLRI